MNNRPIEIKRFEVLYYISLLIGIVIAALDYGDLQQTASPLLVGFVQLFTLAIMVLLIFLIARKASNVAKWFLVVMWAIGIVFYIPLLSKMLDMGFTGFLSVIQLFLQAAGIYYLFTNEVKLWMKEAKNRG